MNKLISISFVLSLLLSCSENNISTITPLPDNPIKSIPSLNYYILPESENNFTVVLEDSRFISGEVLIDVEKDSLLGTFARTSIQGYIKTASQIIYNNILDSIDLIFNLKMANNDTVFQYSAKNYKHQFVNNFEVSKISDYSANSIILDKTISPDRSKIFFIEYFSVPLNYKLKSIDLRSNTITTIDENFKPESSLYGVTEISAISTTEIIAKTILQNYQAGSDTADLCKYDISSKKFDRIAYISYNYSTMSSVVNNHILFGKPTGSQSAAYIAYNVHNNTFSETSGFFYSFNKRTDNIWQGNAYFEEQLNRFIELPYNSSENHVYFYNRETKFTIINFMQYPFYSMLKVFRDGQLLYQDNLFVKKDIFFIDGANGSEDNLYVYIRFNSLEDKSKDGYYEINISANTIKLIHTSQQLGSAYWSNQNEFIVFQFDGIYKYKIPN